MNNRLRELRAIRRWSQADLADRLDVSRQTVNSIENGRYDPSLPLAFRISEVFAIPIDRIFLPTGRPAVARATTNDFPVIPTGETPGHEHATANEEEAQRAD